MRLNRLFILLAISVALSVLSCRTITQSAHDTGTIKSEVFNYGPEKGQNVDIRMPSAVGAKTDSVVIIHGGAWNWGDRADYAYQAEWLASKGFIVYNMNYRLGTASRFRTLAPKIEDIATIVSLASRRAGELGASGRIHLTGSSAGGHMSLLYAYGEGRGKIASVVDINGPTDLANGFYRKNGIVFSIGMVMGTSLNDSSRATYRSASPLYLVEGGECPTLIIHGDADPTVDYQDSVRLDAALDAAGCEHRLITFKGKDHGRNWGSPEWNETNEETLAWFTK